MATTYNKKTNTFIDTIVSVLDGQSPMVYFGTEGSFLSSIAVDPDQTIDQASTFQKAGGVITPVGYAQFSGAYVNAQVVAHVTSTKKEQLLYTVLSDGSLVSHTYSETTGWGTEADISAHNDSKAGGACYYNNYIYIFGSTDVSRYGGLDGSPTLAFNNDFWVTTLAKKPLNSSESTGYPTQNSVRYPYRACHVHSNNCLYFGDYVAGKGVIHKIKTTPQLAYDAQSANFSVGLTLTGGTSGATATISADTDAGTTGTLTLTDITGTFQDNETITDSGSGSATANGVLQQGAGNDGSAYNVLVLPSGYHITDIESWGTDLVISAVQFEETSSITTRGGSGALFFWDTFSDSFYKKVDIPDNMVSAMLNVNGELYVWHGNLGEGHTISRYLGGYQLERLAYVPDASPPCAFAVDGFGGRVSWGCTINYPEKAGVIMSIGYKSGVINPKALHCIARATGDNGTIMGISAIKYAVREEQGVTSQLVLSWRDTDGSSTYGIDAYSPSATTDSIFRSFVYSKPRRFQINKIRIPLAKAVASNMSITPKIYVDNASTTYDNNNDLAVINSTNYPNSEQIIVQYPKGVIGINNYFLELTQAHSTAQSVLLPIVIEGEYLED